MTQKGKSGVDCYYYCRGFGPVLACGYPGSVITTRERYEHQTSQDVGRKKWIYIASQQRYQFVSTDEDLP